MNGIVQIVPTEAFVDPDYGVSRSDRFDRMLALLEEEVELQHDFGVWVNLSAAIKRGAIFVIEAKSPVEHLSLKFSLEAPDAGTYSIKTMPRGEIEDGRTQKVVRLKRDLKDGRFRRVAEFEYRFLILSLSRLHPLKQRVWILGISAPVEPPPEKEEPNDASSTSS